MICRLGNEIDLLKKWCAIDCRSRLGLTGIRNLAAQVGDRLRALGFECRSLPAAAGEGCADHLVAVRNGKAALKIALLGHLDVVLSPDEAPFRVEVRAGRLRGAGVCDMKGGLVAMCRALDEALRGSAAVRRAQLVTLLNASEEQSVESFARAVRHRCKGARACLCFEYGFAGGEKRHLAVHARKGISRYRLRCRGVSAHAGGSHRLGANAIREVARKIEQIESLTDYAREITANVGVVSGGRAANQVPDRAECEFELRAFDAAIMRELDRAVRKVCAQGTVVSSAGRASCVCSLERLPGFPPFPRNRATDELLHRYIRLAAKRGIGIGSTTRGGASDANHAVELAPVLDGLGPLGDGAHTPDEWMDIGTLEPRIHLAADLIMDLCENS